LQQRPYADRDLEILRHIQQMETDSEPMEDKDRVQYTESRAAIERMRTAMHARLLSTTQRCCA